MIETISTEKTSFRDLALAAAASNYQPPVGRTQQLNLVRPEADLIRSIGFSTDADAFRGSSPDLQSLLDSLLNNFGSDKDLPDSEASDPEVEADIRDNNQGSREAADSLLQTAQKGEQTISVEERFEARKEATEAPANKDLTVAELQSGLSASDQDVSGSEHLTSKAQTAKTQAASKPNLKEDDQRNLQESSHRFEQKAAAAESATRLHRVMIERVLRRVEELQFEEQDQEDKRVDQRDLVAA